VFLFLSGCLFGGGRARLGFGLLAFIVLAARWQPSVRLIRLNVRFGSLADILARLSDVRFTPESGQERQSFSTFDPMYNWAVVTACVVWT
jgi:hypothetical protein